jgi:hypothetical protein
LGKAGENPSILSFYPLPSKKNMSNCVYPCPCGYYGDSQKPCTYAPATLMKYQKRISGPLLDRIDIHIEVPRVDYEKAKLFGHMSKLHEISQASAFQTEKILVVKICCLVPIALSYNLRKWLFDIYSKGNPCPII